MQFLLVLLQAVDHVLGDRLAAQHHPDKNQDEAAAAERFHWPLDFILDGLEAALLILLLAQPGPWRPERAGPGLGFLELSERLAAADQDGDGALDYSTIWGAGIGFDLCAQSEEEAAAGGVPNDAGVLVPVKFPISACPYNPDLVTKMIGVAVRFSGVVNATELRVQFNEGDNVANSYYKVAPADVAASTVMNVEFEDPLVRTHYNPKLKPGDTDANNLLAIQFMVPTDSAGPVDWDFCVDAISAITAP